MEHEAAKLGLVWAIPFVGMLLSIGLFPLIAPHFWHHHFGKISAMWAVLFAIPYFIVHYDVALHDIMHIYIVDYVPFLILLWSLFTVAGGILVRGTLSGNPRTNTCIIMIGTLLASWVGTTGASMLLIRPLLRANETRKYKTHTVIFFIFLVSNVGGSLTPLGDPPLFLGFLHHVPFFWTLTNLFVPMITTMVVLLIVYFAMDIFWYAKETQEAKAPPASIEPFGIVGKRNFGLLALVIVGVLVSGYWKPRHLEDPAWKVHEGAMIVSGDIPHEWENLDKHGRPKAGTVQHDMHSKKQDLGKGDHAEVHGHHGLTVPIENIARDSILILAGLVSLMITPKGVRAANGFSWFPIQEVAILFAGIFMTIIPALKILGDGTEGALGWLVEFVSTPSHYFWVTGGLSSFLDNAPTYLTFLNTANGQFFKGVAEKDAVAMLIAQKNNYLVAISAGAVFMGANTYIGNAPNFMVKSIAEEGGVKMPDFFSYIIKYSLPFLIPTFLLINLLFLKGA